LLISTNSNSDCSVEREFISFEVAGDVAHFRRQYAITTALTYPIPPRTALCGLVGALLGLAKNDGLAELTDSKAIFGLQLLQPDRTGHISINLLQTKGGLLAWRTAENPRSAMRYEVIREPHYRVLFSHVELGPKLLATLSSGESHYTPCLGLAWMLASLEGQPRRIVGREVTNGDEGPRDFFSPVRTDPDVFAGEVAWDDDDTPDSGTRIYQRVRMPAEMQPDRRVTRYQEYLVETTGRPIRARLNSYWQLDDGTAFSPM
jgi:CRISPR-associated protein Cas5h